MKTAFSGRSFILNATQMSQVREISWVKLRYKNIAVLISTVNDTEKASTLADKTNFSPIIKTKHLRLNKTFKSTYWRNLWSLAKMLLFKDNLPELNPALSMFLSVNFN